MALINVRARLLSFSILYRIELGGTKRCMPLYIRLHSFSILYRIELGGTCPCIHCDLGIEAFQYPLSDRVGWNYVDYTYYSETFLLSVSSIGSSWVEQRNGNSPNAGSNSFQYPLSDRVGWNCSFCAKNEPLFVFRGS